MIDLHSDEEIVRPARPGDAEDICEIYRACVPDTLVGWTALGSTGGPAWVAATICESERWSVSRFFVLQRGERCLAFAEFRRSVSGPLMLNNIHVCEQAQGGGRGRRLLIEALARVVDRGAARGFAPFWLELDVFADNRRAGDWYTRLGFVEQSVRGWWQLGMGLERWTGSAGAVDRSNFFCSGMASGDLHQRQFGFSSFTVQTAHGSHQIGRMGSDWFRLYDPRALEDPAILPSLAAIDPDRGIFVIAQSKPATGFRRVFESRRMAADLGQARTRLELRLRAGNAKK